MDRSRREGPELDAVPGLRGLWFGLLAYRWATFGWMAVLAAISRAELRRPLLALAAIAATGLWVAWLTGVRAWQRPAVLAADVALALALLVVSGLVMAPGSVGRGAPFFATSYPASAAMAVGAARGIAPGLAAAALLCVGLAGSRQANGMPLGGLRPEELSALVNGIVYYLSAGGAVGVVSTVLRRSGAELRRAVEEAARQRERAARFAEREAIGREIHDSVLQALAMVVKRGRELARRAEVPAGEVRELVDLAWQQERALRSLLQRPPEEPPAGTVPLRTVLEAAAFGVPGLPVEVTTVDPLWLPSGFAEGLGRAVRQALENTAAHARATRASIFAERAGAGIVVTVRDDGVGFVYDEEQLRRDGKLGLLKSMKGRIEELGGTMRVRSAPGTGTEVEFRLPAGEGPEDGRS
ncbi:MAG TPA: ATP-binding protein [Actinomycetota bacterium]|nr:ATP-binding protein [Actinomycetota bacterium]